MATGKHVPSSASPGCTSDASGKVGGHFAAGPPGRPAPVASSTDDMRDGDSDSGASVPQEPQTTVPGSAASEAFRGGGTP